MDAKDYAKGLYNIMYTEFLQFDKGVDLEGRREHAKKAAIKCVHQILGSNPTIKGTSKDMITQIVQTKAYYYQVLNEINKI